MKPNKKEVGARIRQIKDSLVPPLSLVDFGKKLKNKDGKEIAKGTVDSWIRGLALVPENIAIQIAELGNTTSDWIYWGGLRNYLISFIHENNYGAFFSFYPEDITRIVERLEKAGYSDMKLPSNLSLDSFISEVYRPKYLEYIEQVTEPYVTQIPNYLFSGIASEGSKETQQLKFLDLVKKDIEKYQFPNGGKIVWGDRSEIEQIALERFSWWKEEVEEHRKQEAEENNNILNYLIENTKDEEGVKNILSNITFNKRFNFHYDTNLSKDIVEAFLKLHEYLVEVDKKYENNIHEKQRTFKERVIGIRDVLFKSNE